METPIQLTPKFWDCECDEGYLHHHSIPYCARCETFRDEQPDSRVNEVAGHLPEIFAEVFRQFTLAVGDILEVEHTRTPGKPTGPVTSDQCEAMPAWAATVIADRLACLRALQSKDGLVHTAEDDRLEADYEDRFRSPDNGEW